MRATGRRGRILKAPTLDAAPSAPATPSAARPAKVVDRTVLLAHREARQILEDAENRAGQIVAEAAAAAKEQLDQARKEGFAEGLARLEQQLIEAADARAGLLEQARSQAVELALKLAEKILRQRLDHDPAALVPVVEEALRALQGGGAVKIRVHPAKSPALAEHRRQLLDQDPRWSRLDIIADEGLDEDGCLVESEIGSLDAGVGQQLRALGRILRQAAP